jgi:hypothetical protein
MDHTDPSLEDKQVHGATMSSADCAVGDLPDKCQSLRLRSIRKRIETERNKHLPKQRKQRERPAPLSKYRKGGKGAITINTIVKVLNGMVHCTHGMAGVRNGSFLFISNRKQILLLIKF